MFNVYPVRATNPDDLSFDCDYAEKLANEKAIAEFVNYKNYDIWLAYGDIIEKRKYLRQCLVDLKSLPELVNVTYFHRGLTKKGNPRHPLYIKNDVLLSAYAAV
jgi:hypothetical protein